MKFFANCLIAFSLLVGFYIWSNLLHYSYYGHYWLGTPREDAGDFWALLFFGGWVTAAAGFILRALGSPE